VAGREGCCCGFAAGLRFRRGIDGIVAAIMATALSGVGLGGPSVYEDRGILTIGGKNND